MRMSKLFTKTLRESPADDVSINAQLLTRAGYIHKVMAGVYEYLPLGFRVLKKIEQIIREEMNAVGGQEVLLTTLQDPAIWKKTGRWDDAVVDNWFKTQLANKSELGLANTHEEPLTALVAGYVSSYRDLPFSVYQMQNKFRNELRAKSGVLRGREFIMKDLYSFSRTQEEHEHFYAEATRAYHNVFRRAGIGDNTFITFASGGSFSKYSHEFQALCEAGEDIIYLDDTQKMAVNKEVYTDEVLRDIGLSRNRMREVKAIEVGNIFSLGTRFSDALGLMFTDEDGTRKPVIMGSYGIGLGRLMGTIVELCHDKSGMVWPASVSPFAIHLVALDGAHEEAERLYAQYTERGVEALFDDRSDKSPGEKFADADLMGVPVRVVVSKRTLEKGSVEVKRRAENASAMVPLADALSVV